MIDTEQIGAESLPIDRVLVVEDDAGMRRAFRRLLEAAGFEVVEAIDGAAGLRELDELKEGPRLQRTRPLPPQRHLGRHQGRPDDFESLARFSGFARYGITGRFADPRRLRDRGPRAKFGVNLGRDLVELID